MEEADADGGCEGLPAELSNVFIDTNILLNYAQRVIETDFTSPLIDSDRIDIVVGVTVAEELDEVSERRADIYADFVDYLLEEDEEIGNYDPDSRHPYFDANDRQHVRNIQMRLSQLGDRAEIQRQLRRATRAMKRRFEYLREEVVPDAMFEAQPGITLMFALDDVITNDKDRNVVGDAALWAAEAENSSGVFVTMDKKDLVNVADEINDALRDAKAEAWMLRIMLPTDVPLETAADADTEAVADSS